MARGNFVIDIQWQHGRLTAARIWSRSGGSCTVRYQEQQVQIRTVPGPILYALRSEAFRYFPLVP
ncbi:glycoside hydrolase family 95-like protein [Niabella aurantiaca]|uniref:glycoside hydrolase family 95-like protein n=1 Tax=Niabella aurantiaca TaxID=379900 RepID=UPI00035DB12B|nr:hypothetical protein [Niabella aurantiaca]